MAENSYPFDGDPLPEDGWSKMARLFGGQGVYGDPGSTALQVFADSSGMNVFVRTGRALVRGHYYENTAQMTVAIPSNGAGSARIDRIVLRLDPTADSITAVRVAGTAGAAAAPALTQTDTGIFDIPLAQVRVEPGAVNIAMAKVTDDRWFTGVEVLPTLSAGQGPTPRVGEIRWDAAVTAWRGWNGSAYKTLQESLGVSGGNVAGGYTPAPFGDGNFGQYPQSPRYSVVNGWCNASGSAMIGTAGTYPGPTAVTLPVAPLDFQGGDGYSGERLLLGTWRIARLDDTQGLGQSGEALAHFQFGSWFALFYQGLSPYISSRPNGEVYQWNLSYPVA